MDLKNKKCKPCEGGVEPFNHTQAGEYLIAVPGWSLGIDGLSIQRTYAFSNFKKSLDFVNHVGMVAEAEGHHPDIVFGWGYATITLSTHAVKGLSENDFILAYKIDSSS